MGRYPTLAPLLAKGLHLGLPYALGQPRLPGPLGLPHSPTPHSS